MENECNAFLNSLTGKKHVLFTNRGNKAIKLAVQLVKSLGFTELYMQDQGGWLTYKQFSLKTKLVPIELRTDYGLINDLPKIKPGSALLVNSIPAYAYYEDMGKIDIYCKDNNILLINDATGTINTDLAKIGHVVLGSFGRNKPINLGTGGFIATDNDSYFKFLQENNVLDKPPDYKRLFEKMNELDERTKRHLKISSQIKDDLKDFEIVHKDREGFNVIIKFKNQEQRLAIIAYCQKHMYEYIECPRYIRVLENAVCIEVKRL